MLFIKKSVVLFSVLFSLLLAGCMDSHQPSESQIVNEAKTFFNQEFQGLFLAETVKKTNGYSKNDTNYVAELTISGRAQSNIQDYAKNTLADPNLSAMDKMSITLQMGVLTMTLPEFAKEDLLEFEREYLFVKTDNGWQIKEQLQTSSSRAY